MFTVAPWQNFSRFAYDPMPACCALSDFDFFFLFFLRERVKAAKSSGNPLFISIDEDEAADEEMPQLEVGSEAVDSTMEDVD